MVHGRRSRALLFPLTAWTVFTCTSAVRAQEDEGRILRNTKNDGMIQSSIRIGKPEPSGPKWLQPARSAAGKFRESFSRKPKAVNDDPTSLSSPMKKPGPDIFIAAAVAQEKIGNNEKAIVAYRKALEITPNDQAANLGLARTLNHKGESKKSIAIYKKLLASNPQDALVWNDLGLCYTSNRQLADASLALRKAVELAPQNVMYRNNLATALVKNRQLEDALSELTVVHGTAAGHYNLAFLLHNEGDVSTAIFHTTKAIQEDPRLAPAHELHRTLQQRLNTLTPRPQSPARIASRPVAPVSWVTSESGYEEPVSSQPSEVQYGVAYAADTETPAMIVNDGTVVAPSTHNAPVAESADWASEVDLPVVAPLPDSAPATRAKEIAIPAGAQIRPLVVPASLRSHCLSKSEPDARHHAPTPRIDGPFIP